MNYEKLVSPIILKRGKSYYNSNCVKNVKIEDNFIKANVSGSNNKIYNVSISNYSNSGMRCRCNCIFASDNSICKHIIAVLIYVDNEKSANISVSEIKTIIDNKFESISNRYGRINNYRKLEAIYKELIEYIDSKLKNNQKNDALLLLKYGIIHICNYGNYVSRTVLDDFLERIGSLLDDYYHNTIEWFYKKNYTRYDDKKSKISIYLVSKIDTKEKLLFLLDTVNKKELDKGTEEKVLELKYQYLNKEDIISELYKKINNRFSFSELKILIKMLDQENRYDEVINLANKYVIQVYNDNELSDRLEKIYLEYGKDIEYVKFLKNGLILKQNIKYYKKLKSKSSNDEWQTEKKQIIDLIKENDKLHIEILKEEKQYEDLFNILKKVDDFSLINLYQDDLINYNKDKFFVLCKYLIMKIAIYENGYHGYQEVTQVIRNIHKIRGSREIIIGILDLLAVIYANNHMLYYELSRFASSNLNYELKKNTIYLANF